MEDRGAGAVVLFSLFEEQIRSEIPSKPEGMDEKLKRDTESQKYFPEISEYRVGSESYLEIIRQAKERVNIPVIASLNGVTPEGWIEYGKQMEEAGADAIELNVFFIPTDMHLTSTEVEYRYTSIVQNLKNHVSVPIAVKLNPYFSALANMAKRLEDAGADGLVLFNRFYQPDFNIHELRVVSSLEFSSANEIRLPLLWLSALFGRINASLAASTGVQSSNEVIKYLLAGSDIAMTASTLYKHGIKYIQTMNDDITNWMEMHQFSSIDQFKGILSQQNVSDLTAFERANYIKILERNERWSFNF
jgi:dihydroorotate dehydrogenase (fumarate)